MRNRRTDDDDLENQFFLTALSRLVSLRSRTLSLSPSSVRSYALSLDHNGSADGRGMAGGWSRKTTMFLLIAAPRLDSLDPLDPGLSRAPQHDVKEVNHEEKVSDNMVPGCGRRLKVKRRRHVMPRKKRKRRTSSDQHPNKEDVTEHMRREAERGGADGPAIFT